MGILKDFTQKLERKDRVPISQKLSGLKNVFGEPQEVEVRNAFCDPLSKKPCVTICAPGGGCSCGCEEVRQALVEELARLKPEITVGNIKTGCSGSCQKGPIMGFPQKQFFYQGITAADVPDIVEHTILRGRILFNFVSIEPERSYRPDLFYDKHTGLLAAIDETTCMVEAAKYFLDFEEGLSCGKCVPCRIGLKRALECIGRITEGEGTEEDLEQIRTLCALMDDTPNCEFAVTSIRPVLSAVTYFESEFQAHIQKKTCPAGVCTKLVELQRKLAVRARLAKTK